MQYEQFIRKATKTYLPLHWVSRNPMVNTLVILGTYFKKAIGFKALDRAEHKHKFLAGRLA